ncbi:MAG: hypothetical protein AUJ49_09935 [Desulfovibrionaceae bacterium CG1_02_65_16]|nr:MAG: hypothetical protein AUJ49_09935 [Desulfovibrionaceae bacterium CG1_02_65_16]
MPFQSNKTAATNAAHTPGTASPRTMDTRDTMSATDAAREAHAALLALARRSGAAFYKKFMIF